MHPGGVEGAPPPPTPGTLKEAAISDAERIEAERKAGLTGSAAGNGTVVGEKLLKELGVENLSEINEEEARKVMSAEHKALGYRPPAGSLAADAQRVAARKAKEVKELEEKGETAEKEERDRKERERERLVDMERLQEAARKDAQRIA